VLPAFSKKGYIKEFRPIERDTKPLSLPVLKTPKKKKEDKTLSSGKKEQTNIGSIKYRNL